MFPCIKSFIGINLKLSQDRRKVWKSGGARSNVVGTICPPWLRLTDLPKTLWEGGALAPGPPGSDIPAVWIRKKCAILSAYSWKLLHFVQLQQKHAFNQPRCMYFSALPPRTPCVWIFWSFVMWMKALLCTIPPNTKFTGKTNHSYTTTKQLEKRFWLCQKFRGQLFVPEPVVRRKGEKSINALAPLLLGAVAIFRMFVSTFYNGTILVTFRPKGTLVEFQVTIN